MNMAAVKRCRITFIVSLALCVTLCTTVVSAVPLPDATTSADTDHPKQILQSTEKTQQATTEDKPTLTDEGSVQKVDTEEPTSEKTSTSSTSSEKSDDETIKQPFTTEKKEEQDTTKPEIQKEVSVSKVEDVESTKTATDTNKERKDEVSPKADLEKEDSMKKIEQPDVKSETSEKSDKEDHLSSEKEEVTDKPDLEKESSVNKVNVDEVGSDDKKTLSITSKSKQDEESEKVEDKPDVASESSLKKVEESESSSTSSDKTVGVDVEKTNQWISIKKDKEDVVEKSDIKKESTVRKVEEPETIKSEQPNTHYQWVSLSTETKKEDDTEKPDLKEEGSVKKIEEPESRKSLANEEMIKSEALSPSEKKEEEKPEFEKEVTPKRVVDEMKESIIEKKEEEPADKPSLEEESSERKLEETESKKKVTSDKTDADEKKPLSVEKTEEKSSSDTNPQVDNDSVKSSEQAENKSTSESEPLASSADINATGTGVKKTEGGSASSEGESVTKELHEAVKDLKNSSSETKVEKESPKESIEGPGDAAKLSVDSSKDNKTSDVSSGEESIGSAPKSTSSEAEDASLKTSVRSKGDSGEKANEKEESKNGKDDDHLPTNARIINGEEVKSRNEFPFVVDMSESDVAISSRRFCTGTLIDRTTVLTAAHCVINQGYRAPVYATVGRVELEDGHRDNHPSATFRTVASMVHPEYSGIGSPYDVAVLLLNKTCETSDPVALTEEGAKNGTKAWVVGYGIQTIGTLEETARPIKILAGRLQKSQLRVVPREECDLPTIGLKTEEGLLCTRGMKLGASACMGDSGGGLFELRGENEGDEDGKVENGNHGLRNRTIHQVGIVSYGDSHCAAEESGVFTDVSNVREWIRYASSRLHMLMNSAPVDLHMDDNDSGTELSHTDYLGGKVLDKYAHEEHLEKIAVNKNHTGEHNVKHYIVTTNFSKKTDVHVSLCKSIKLKTAKFILATSGAVLSVKVDNRNGTLTNHGSCARGKLGQVTVPGLEKDRFVIGISSNASIPIRLTLTMK